MTNYAKLDHKNRLIVMDRKKKKNADVIGTKEYYQLQECRKNYPDYQAVTRKIKRKEGQNHYEGLDYLTMREYIIRHEPIETLDFMLEKFDTLLLDMDCISKGHAYPRVKSWFIKNYPEVKQIGKLYEIRPQQENAVVPIETAA